MSFSAFWITSAALCLGQLLPLQPAGSSTAVIELRPRYSVDRPLLYRITETQTIADQAEGAEAIQTTCVIWLRLTPLEATHASARLLARVERMQWKVQGPGEPVSFDTLLARGRTEPKEFSTFRDLLSRRFHVTIAATGAAMHVAAVDSPRPDAISEAGAEHVRRWMAMQSAWLPDEPIAVRDVWQREESLPIGLVEMTRKNRLRIARVDDERAYIEGQIELSGRGGDGIREGSDRLVASVVAASPGKSAIVFRRLSGVVERIESRVAFEMRVIRIPADEAQSPIVSAQKLSATALVELMDENPNVAQ